MIPVTAPYAALLGVCLLGYFIVYPVFEYFRDPKGTYLTTRLMRCIKVNHDQVSGNTPT